MSTENGPKWSWPGVIALVIAVGVSIALCVSLIAVALSPHPVSQQFAGVLSALSGAAMGALATYLGAINTGQQRDDAPEAGPERKG
ncbi:hypothetical protein [Streptomyces sp. FIT100]|uniref:hypothetical protein n=1 Tax=Streptomyces sp. FIT100 TaxID=2837956 RepID=UPI0021C6B0ED|nr:hypothetical protein [Streptomyces sp. FIT100]UUN30904.1 hypothetical protein KK483_34655 [Streptomyces sp. FIT100]